MSSSFSTSYTFVWKDCVRNDILWFAITAAYSVITLLVLLLIMMPLFIRYLCYDIDCCGIQKKKQKRQRLRRIKRKGKKKKIILVHLSSLSSSSSSKSPLIQSSSHQEQRQRQRHPSQHSTIVEPEPEAAEESRACTFSLADNNSNSDANHNHLTLTEYKNQPQPAPQLLPTTSTTRRTKIHSNPLAEQQQRQRQRHLTGAPPPPPLPPKWTVILHLTFFAFAIIAVVLNIYTILRLCFIYYSVPWMAALFAFIILLQGELLVILLFNRLYDVFKDSVDYRLSRITITSMILLFVVSFLALSFWSTMEAFYYETYPLLTAIAALFVCILILLLCFSTTFLFVRKLYQMVNVLEVDEHSGTGNRERQLRKFLPLMVRSSLLVAMAMTAASIDLIAYVVLRLYFSWPVFNATIGMTNLCVWLQIVLLAVV